MSTLELKAYEIFKSKLGEKEAETLIEYFDTNVDDKLKSKSTVFLTKDDKVDLIKWMVGFWIAQMAAIVGLYIRK